MPIDLEKFNSDPKHEKDREQLDSLVEGSISRIKAKHEKANPPKEKGLLEDFFSGLFGDSK